MSLKLNTLQNGTTLPTLISKRSIHTCAFLYLKTLLFYFVTNSEFKVPVYHIPADFQDEYELRKMCSTIMKKHHPGIDILVNNAGRVLINFHYKIMQPPEN